MNDIKLDSFLIFYIECSFNCFAKKNFDLVINQGGVIRLGFFLLKLKYVLDDYFLRCRIFMEKVNCGIIE